MISMLPSSVTRWLFYFSSFSHLGTSMKIFPMGKVGPKLFPHKIAHDYEFLPKWQNLAKSGHTASKEPG